MKQDVLSELCRMTTRLGRPEHDYVILGEGNTSAIADDGTFWVTTSGSELVSATPDSFVRVDHARALSLLDGPALTDEQTREGLIRATVDGRSEPRPSVETTVHAVFLSIPGVKFVGHTHPTAINMLTCSKRFAESIAGRVFPDEVVLCGPETLPIPYVDPGIPLAREIRSRLADFRTRTGSAPKVVMLQNHGMVALGSSAQEVENITAMAVKAARITVGTAAFGGPSFMPDADVCRIRDRLDEHYRQRVIEQKAGRSS